MRSDSEGGSGGPRTYDENTVPAPTESLTTNVPDDRPLVWPVPLCIGWGVACVAVPWLHLQTVAAIYQGVGVALTALGLAAIGDRVQHARKATAAAVAKAQSRVVAWSAERFAAVWSRLTGKPRTLKVQASSQVRAIGSLGISAEVHHGQVDRDTISDRDWLIFLDNRLTSVLERLDATEKRRNEDREAFARRLGIQRDELRAEIVRETRNGWQLVAWGLGYTFIGVALGAFV